MPTIPCLAVILRVSSIRISRRIIGRTNLTVIKTVTNTLATGFTPDFSGFGIGQVRICRPRISYRLIISLLILVLKRIIFRGGSGISVFDQFVPRLDTSDHAFGFFIQLGINVIIPGLIDNIGIPTFVMDSA